METETDSHSSSQSSPSTCISRGSSPYNKLQRNKTDFFQRKKLELNSLQRSETEFFIGPKPPNQLEKIQHELAVVTQQQQNGKPETEINPNILNVKYYQDNLPELPEKTRQKVVDEFGLGFELVVRLVNEPELLELFLKAQNCGEKILCQTRLAHLLLLDVAQICSKHLSTKLHTFNNNYF